jgi:toxin YoeB
LPSLSLTGCTFWENSTLSLRITDSETNESLSENILNLFSPQSLNNKEFAEWIKSITVEIELSSTENIVKLFPPEKYQFDQRALSDILSWFYDDKRFLIRIKNLLNDIVKNPYSGGLGKTELLSEGKVSKRIIKKDRIVYSIANEIIAVHQCRGHYNDN